VGVHLTVSLIIFATDVLNMSCQIENNKLRRQKDFTGIPVQTQWLSSVLPAINKTRIVAYFNYIEKLHTVYLLLYKPML